MNYRLAAGAFALAASTALSNPAAAAERIIFNCFFPPQHYVCAKILPEMKTRIETATEARVKVNIPPKSLSAPPDQYDGVVGGVMDGALQFNPFIAGQAPGIQFSELPFTGTLKGEVAGQALWNTYQKFFGDKNEYGDAVLISVMASAGAEIYSLQDKPIETVDDISSRKMWGLPGVVANILKEAGSSVVAGPAVQMLEIISKGVVDGYAGVAWSEVAGLKLIDYTKAATIMKGKVFQPTFSLMISRAKWEAISPEDRDAIMAVMGADFAQFAGRVFDEDNDNGREAAKQAGVVLVDGSDELESKLRALGQPMIDAWIKQIGEAGVDGEEVLSFYAAEIARLSAANGG